MRRNIQHSTFNVQHPTASRRRTLIECWALNVECSVFLLFCCVTLPVFAQANTNALPPLAPPLPEMPPTFWQLHGTAILVGVFVFLALAGFVAWVIFKPRPQPVLPPAVVAREALAKLQRQPEDGKILSEISQVLRRYIGTAFEFPSAELTTAEFSAMLAGNEKVGAELARTISSFLRECDRRKFSPIRAASPLNAASRALQLVAEIEQRRAELNAANATSR